MESDPPADKAALESALAAAENQKSGVKVSEDGKNAWSTEDYVTPAEMDALEKAVEEAWKVIENPDATQGDADRAAEALNKAIEGFKGNKKKGTPLLPLPAGGLRPGTAAVYSISLTQSGPYTFPAQAYGNSPTPLTVTVTNTGTVSTGALTVELGGDNYDDFIINTEIAGEDGSVATIAASGTDTFTVKPRPGLAASTIPYTATVSVSGGNGISGSFTLSFMVNKVTRTVAPAIAVTGVSTSVGITYTLAASDPPEMANYDVYYKQGNHTLPADTSDTGFSGDSWTKVSGQGAGTGITIAYGSLTPDSGGYGYTLAAAARNANYHDSVSTAVLAPYTKVITLGIDRSAATAGLGWTFAGDV